MRDSICSVVNDWSMRTIIGSRSSTEKVMPR